MEVYFNSNLGDFGVSSYKEYVEKYPDQSVLKSDYETHQVKILMRQTTYSKDECIQHLTNKSIEQCIQDFLGISPKENIKSRSVNQNIFKAIRDNF